jgi:AraC-like DNA-binding protein
MNDLWVIGFTGAAVGGAVGWPLLRGVRVTNGVTPPAIRLLGALLLFGGMSAGVIAARHGALLSPAIAIAAEHVIYGGNLLFWTALTIWVRSALGVSTARHAAAALMALPCAAYLAYAVVFREPPPFIVLLPVGTAATGYLCTLWLRRRAELADALSGALVTRMIAFAIALNTAQAIRTFFSDVSALREIVPITMTACFLSLAALGVRSLLASPRVPVVAPARPYARSTLDEQAAERLLEALDRGMRDGHWYREVALSLPVLATKLGTRPHLVSQALNQVKKTTLNDYLAAWRVSEARRLLADPASDRFTIDALAEAAGFASRSAFYKAFKRREGVTPTEFRTRARSAPLPK